MNHLTPLNLTLPDDLVADLRARVAAGHYPDEAAAVTDALRSAFGHDTALESWARTEAVAALEEHRRDPAAAIHVDDVMQELERRRAERRGAN